MIIPKSDINRYTSMIRRTAEAYVQMVIAQLEEYITSDNTDDWAAFLLPLLFSSAEGIVQDGSTLGVEFFTEITDALGITDFMPEYFEGSFELPSFDEIIKRAMERGLSYDVEVETEISEKAMQQMLKEITERLNTLVESQIVQNANAQITGNVAAANAKGYTKLRYAMIPQNEDPCAFCMVVASQGFVYHHNRSHMNHNDCNCIAVPGIMGSTDVEEYNNGNEYLKAYKEANYGNGLTDTLHNMREMGFAKK